MTAPHATHPTPEQLAAFAARRLGAAQARAVAAHLKECPACRRAAGKARGTTAAPGAAAAAPPPAGPPTGLPAELANHPRYRVLRELGRGGMGVVYQAEQTLMCRPVAIKILGASLLEQPGAAERFQREVQAAARLVHPNIVIAHDAERAGGLYMLVMEYVEGQSLGQLLRRQGPLPVGQACHYVRQAALGLQHAFEKGMVHRDIKPQNLMLTPDGQVKILDFGLAKMVRESGGDKSLTSANAYMGTPDYSAPEQAADARKADIRADIYSLGCTLYALLAGHAPFKEDTAVLTILAHIGKEPPSLTELRPGLPPELWAVVARMLAKDPAGRYQTPAEVAAALAPFCKKGTKAVPPPVAAGPPVALQPTAVPHNTSRLPSLARPPAAGKASAAGAGPVFELVEEAPAPRQAAAGRRWLWLAGGGAAVVLLLLFAAGAGVLALLVLKAKPANGTMLLQLNEPDAEVWVDGRRVPGDGREGGGPLRVAVAEGRHEIQVRKEGFRSDTRDVVIEAGGVRNVKVDLLPLAPVAVRPPEPEPSEPSEPEPQPTEKPAPRPAEKPAPPPAEKFPPPAPPAEPMPPPEPRPQPPQETRPPVPPAEPGPAPPPEPEKHSAPSRKRPGPRRVRPAQPPVVQNPEEVAARYLKEAKDLVETAKLKRLKGEVKEADRLMGRAGDRLHEITTKYPSTKAATEADDLLTKEGL